MEKDIEAILKALEDPQWEWRTIDGIADATKLPEPRFLQVVDANRDLIVESEVPSADGKRLFTSARRLVIKALEDDRWDWRTIRGIAEDTKLTQAAVRRVIDENSDVIVKSDVPSVKGEALYTTVDHWDRKASIGQKIRGSFRNRRK